MNKSVKVCASIEDGTGKLYAGKGDIWDMLDQFTDEERLEIFYRYCLHCGRIQPDNLRGCQCWNDE